MRPQDDVEPPDRFRGFRNTIVLITAGMYLALLVWGLIATKIQGLLGFLTLYAFVMLPVFLYWGIVRSPVGSVLLGLIIVGGMILLPGAAFLFPPLWMAWVWALILTPWVVGLLGTVLEMRLLYPLHEARWNDARWAPASRR